MAVTISIVRNSHTETATNTIEYCTATMSGTYATGGFTFNPRSIVAGPGSSAMSGGRVILDIDWRSPSGYVYRTTSAVSGQVTTATTKIFSAPGTELANGTAVPDATVPVILVKSKN